MTGASDRFSWLFSPCDIKAVNDFCSKDCEEAAEILLGCWQVLPLSLPRFVAWAANHESAQSVIRRAEQRMRADGLVLDLQMKILRRLAAALRERGVPFVLLKSAAMRLVAYEDPSLRRARDIDIGVARPNIERAVEALVETGFESAQWRDDLQAFEMADPAFRAMIENKHHELGFWVRLQEAPNLDPAIRSAIFAQRTERPAQWDLTDETIPAAYIVADIHHGLSLDLPVDDLVTSAWASRFEGDGLPVPRLGWMLFHLVFKIYIEGAFNYSEGAYQYADLCRLLPHLSHEEIDFFAKRIRQANLCAAGHYVLRRLPSNFGVVLPLGLERLVMDWARPDPGLSPGAQNDWGDMWPKLWGAR
jgi:hypothetical protein